MARSFDGADDSLVVASAPVTAVPFSMAGWFSGADLAINQIIVTVDDGTVTNRHALDLGSTNVIRATTQSSGGTVSASSSTTYTPSTWQHACGVWASATSRAAYLNGVNKGTNATNRGPTGIANTRIGLDGTGAQDFSGLIAEVGIWNAALSDAEVAALGRGVNPRFIRPGALVFYAPLWGTSATERDYTAGQRHLTVTGATVGTSHPRIQPFAIGGPWQPSRLIVPGVHEQDIDDAIAGTDGLAKAVTSPQADAIAGVDAVAKSVTELRADTASVSDSLTSESATDIVGVPFFISESETLSVALEVTGSQSYSFGPDREDEGDIPLSIEWSTQNPGGFADGAVTLTRPPWISAADAPLMASYKVTNQGGELRYQGRTKATPQVDVNTIRIEAEGLAAALDDNEYWRFLGVHNDLSAWGEPSVERQQLWIFGGTVPQSNASVEPSDEGLPALVTKLSGTWVDPDVDSAACEAWLDTGGIDIGGINYAWERSEDINVADTNWQWYVSLAEDYQGLVGYDGSGNLLAAGPDGGSFPSGGTGRRFAFVTAYYAAQSPMDGDTPLDVGPSTIWWRHLSVYGTHGLSLEALPDGRVGLVDRDVIEFAVSDGAPSIPVSAGFIDSGSFVIPHVVHAGTVRELIEQITVYGGTGGRLNDWGVYEAFFWRAPGWGETWRVRRDEVEFGEGGPVTENRCSGMVVTYTDGANRELSVGPPGSGADFETDDLEDTSPLNPVTTKTRVREGGLTSQQGAINIGVAALAEANAENRRGQVTITDTVRDSAGNERPTSVVRACDYVLVEDETGGYPPETQPIVGTSYNHDSLSVSCELGLPAPSVEALLARLATRTEGI